MTAVPDSERVPRRRPSGRALVAAVAALAVLVLAPATLGAGVSAAADTDDFHFASFDADYRLERTADGHATMTIVETLVAQFPDFDQNHGIVRAIPERYDDVPLNVQVLSVTDADGAPVPFERSSDDGFARLALGTDEFVHGRQTYVIEYTVDDPIRAFDDTGVDELYWDTNGTGWAQPFARVSARFHVPAELADSLTGAAACYRGPSGSAERCAVASKTAGGGVVLAVDEADLSAGENVTVAIGFEPGTFARPVPLTEAWWATVLPLLLLAAALAAMVAMIAVRLARWGDARGRGIIVPQYTPPEVDLLLAG
ncbi:MAG TPA: DUF2207 domain-containing protein, partial [Naasia sp.]